MFVGVDVVLILLVHRMWVINIPLVFSFRTKEFVITVIALLSIQHLTVDYRQSRSTHVSKSQYRRKIFDAFCSPLSSTLETCDVMVASCYFLLLI